MTMAKKSYEPHPRLGMKVVPSKTDYNRDDNDRAIDEEMAEVFAQNDPVNEFEAEAFFTQEMYEYGFHIEIPEN
jgi:hypothetical protein